MILRWPGSKRWLFTKYPEVFPKNDQYKRYIEPFFGGGSVFFSLNPKTAICSDINSRLINFYESLKKDPELIFYETLGLLNSHSKKQYLEIRETFNTSKPSKTQAINFLYLNRTCFNGVYRENSSGKFNVPMGDTSSFPFKMNDFLGFSLALKNTTLNSCDYKESLGKAKVGDFIYVDPPYLKEDENESFRSYHKNLFTKQDLKELVSVLNKLASEGCKILVSNFDVKHVEELFPRKTWNYKNISQRTFISGRSEGRKLVKEALIYNY